MTRVTPFSALLGAAFALVSERCRNAYTHDIKGGLQSLHSALELLSRSAGMASVNPSMIEKAGALARRALATHESDLHAFMLSTAPGEKLLSMVDLGRLVAEVVQLLRNDAMLRSQTFEPEVSGDISIMAAAAELRMLVLGLCVTRLDAMPPNASLKVGVDRHGAAATLRFSSALPTSSLRAPVYDWFAQPTHSMTSHEFLLGVTSEWALRCGGSLAIESDGAAAIAVLSLPISGNSSA